MRKEEQIMNTEQAEYIFNKAMEEYRHDYDHYLTTSWARLRTCTAWVFETDNYYFLRSYNTIVAVIEKSTDTLADCLRTTYGYTRTSAYHIRKFEQDYCRAKWGCRMAYVAR